MTSRDQAGYQPPSYDEVAGADYEPLSNADEPVAEASRRETSPRAWTTGLFGCFNNDLQTCKWGGSTAYGLQRFRQKEEMYASLQH
jgi:hypothetical protein